MPSTVFLGPSPLTRGNLQRNVQRGREGGPIPAHAGQPRYDHRRNGRSGAHPRSRGATDPAPAKEAAPMGPSPLTRGNLGPGVPTLEFLGPIPAHAGQPRASRAEAAESRAHPRSRGATSPFVSTGSTDPGPSPLTRGNQALAAPRGRRGGPIPAHAGQPQGRSNGRRLEWAHPRSRGATVCPYKNFSLQGGPSPLTRGNLELRQAQRAGDGPIPAHAGQPSRLPTRPLWSRAHPRSRGATGSGFPRLAACGAHPRSRGATCRLVAHTSPRWGPSPLTRGNRC